jgi:hypothetical protein
MTGDVTHEEIQELLGAFALDAVDGEERDLVEAHLAGCPRCRAEVERHRETASLLAHQGERAPDGVWDRIAGALDETPPALDLGRIGRRSVPLRVAALTMAVAAAVILFVGVALGRRDSGDLDRVGRIVDALQKAGLSNAAQAALADPHAEQVNLTSADGRAAAQVVRLADGTGYLVPTKLPALPAGRVYQLWAVRADAKISLGVLGQNPDVSGFRMAGPVVAYAVTEEAAGGVAATANQPVVVGYVKS